METVARLPDSYAGRCEFVVNGLQFDIFAQNIILLLIAFHLPPREATPIMIHIWYSTLIPASFLNLLQTRILHLIDEVCLKADQDPSCQRFMQVWVKNKASLQLELERDNWRRLREYLQVPRGLNSVTATANRLQVTFNDRRSDHVDRMLYCQPPYWRVATMHFRRYGILLPFGCSRRDFDTPNPFVLEVFHLVCQAVDTCSTFFHDRRSWPMPDAADPRTSWDLMEVNNGAYTKDYLAKNDLYGKFFMHVQQTLLAFCRQIAKRDIHLQLLCTQEEELPAYFKETHKRPRFDRIDVG